MTLATLRMRRWVVALAAAVGLGALVGVTQSGVAAPAGDDFGLVDPSTGIWHLYRGGQEATWFYYGNPGDVPFMGDWDCDTIDTPGLYRQSDGYVYLRNSNSQGIADVSFFFGNPGDVPVAGDFNADGCDTVSIYRPSEQRFYIINKLGTNDGGLGAADYSHVFGNPGDKPFIGDFNGNGQDTPGLHRESTGLVYYRNTNTTGIADNQFVYGNPGDRFVAGDWTDNGIDSPGLFRPSDTTMYLRYENSQGNADESWRIGQSTWLPASGSFGTLQPPPGPPPGSGGGEFTAMIVAVRQGDSAVFAGACGETGVIDANRYRTDDILAAIDQIGTRTLKWMAVTHYDADHLGDIVSVATSPGVTVGAFYDRGGGRTVKDSNTYALAAVATKRWAAHIWRRDPRFARYIPKGGETVEQIARSGHPNERRALWTHLDSLEAAVAAQAALSLQDAVAEYVEAISGQHGRRLQVLLARTGLNGRDPIYGTTAARMLGVTPARIYQIQDALERHRIRACPPAGVWMPQVASAERFGWPDDYTDTGIEAARAFFAAPAAVVSPTGNMRGHRT